MPDHKYLREWASFSVNQSPSEAQMTIWDWANTKRLLASGNGANSGFLLILFQISGSSPGGFTDLLGSESVFLCSALVCGGCSDRLLPPPPWLLCARLLVKSSIVFKVMSLKWFQLWGWPPEKEKKQARIKFLTFLPFLRRCFSLPVS